jgi:hypothetical protein
MVIFNPRNKTINVSKVVELFFQYVWYEFGLPLIISFNCASLLKKYYSVF